MEDLRSVDRIQPRTLAIEVDLVPAGGQDQDRQVAGATQLATEVEAVEVRQAHIQDQEIHTAAGDRGEAIAAEQPVLGVEALRTKGVDQRIGVGLLVSDDQDAAFLGMRRFGSGLIGWADERDYMQELALQSRLFGSTCLSHFPIDSRHVVQIVTSDHPRCFWDPLGCGERLQPDIHRL
jgi:hypothetical protein